eukprot:jgi/Tetstr1/463263/TSEL_008188.t1
MEASRCSGSNRQIQPAQSTILGTASSGEAVSCIWELRAPAVSAPAYEYSSDWSAGLIQLSPGVRVWDSARVGPHRGKHHSPNGWHRADEGQLVPTVTAGRRLAADFRRGLRADFSEFIVADSGGVTGGGEEGGVGTMTLPTSRATEPAAPILFGVPVSAGGSVVEQASTQQRPGGGGVGGTAAVHDQFEMAPKGGAKAALPVPPLTPFVPAVFAGTMCGFMAPARNKAGRSVAGKGTDPSSQHQPQRATQFATLDKQPLFFSRQAAARYEDRLNQAAGSPPASGPLGAARHALHWLASPLRRLSGKTLVGAESEKRAVQYITMKTGMCMLCAFPKRYCLVGEDSARSKAESDGATPVYRVPGIKIVIPSQLGPIRMAPLFLCREQLEALLGAAFNGFAEFNVGVRRIRREERKDGALAALSSRLAGTSQTSEQRRVGAEDKMGTSLAENQQVDHFQDKVVNGGASGRSHALSFPASAVYGLAAAGLSIGTAIANTVDEWAFRASSSFLLTKPPDHLLQTDTLQSVVRAAAAHNEPLARPAGGGGGYEMAGDVPEMMLKRYLDMAGAYVWAYDRGIRQEILEKIRKLDAQQFNALNASDKNRTIMSMLPHSRYTAAMYAEVGGIGQLGQTVDQLARLQDGAFMHIDPNPLPGMAQLLLVLARIAREDSPPLSRPSTWPRLADGPRIQGSLWDRDPAADGDGNASPGLSDAGQKGSRADASPPPSNPKATSHQLEIRRVEDTKPGRLQFEVLAEYRSRQGDDATKHSTQPGAGAPQRRESVRVVVDFTKMPGINPRDVEHAYRLARAVPMAASPPAPTAAKKATKTGAAAPRQLKGLFLIGNLQGTLVKSGCPTAVGNAADVPLAIARASSS